MAIEVLFRTQPYRAIALKTSTHVLVLRHSASSTETASSRVAQNGSETARCIVEFTALNAVDLSNYRSLSPVLAQGTLGLITIDHAIFLCVVVSSAPVANVRAGESVQRINGVEFCRYADHKSKAVPTKSH